MAWVYMFLCTGVSSVLELSLFLGWQLSGPGWVTCN